MQIIPLFLKELEQEAQTTRKFLKLVPEDKFSWKPHEKSMPMGRLATHIAELPSWIDLAINTDGINFATNSFKPTTAGNSEGLQNIFEKSYEKGKDALNNAKEEDLSRDWTLRNGEHILRVMSKYESVRHSFSQTTHHRAQLGVYLRLLNIPIPGSYGPSADEMGF